MSYKLFVVSAIVAFAATPAFADPQAGLYGGGQVSYHDAGSFANLDVDSFTYGGYAGFHRPFLGGPLITGLEGNYSFGSGDFDREYGINAHAGLGLGDSAMVFARGGYQWVDFDLYHIAEDALGRPLTGPERLAIDGQDDTDGGFLVGAGLQYSLNSRASARVVVDTIEFDTLKVSLGLALHF